MKDDLISRSDAAEFMFENRMCTSINNAYDKLRCIKTAYDVEKVMEKLEELQQYYIYSIDDLVRLKEVKEILKRGGVEEIENEVN